MGQVPAAARTIAVLRHLAAQTRPVAAAAIARDLELPRSSTYHLLTTLAESRFVTHLPEERCSTVVMSSTSSPNGHHGPGRSWWRVTMPAGRRRRSR